MTAAVFPEEIRVCGFPLMLSVWNGVYHKTTKKSDGCPVYRKNGDLSCFALMLGISIYRNGGLWVMAAGSEVLEIKPRHQATPIGRWVCGIRVQPVKR
jgi:hypothetical protein